MDSLLDQVAILHQFADERIDLAQTQGRLRAALQDTSHEAVLGHAQLQGHGAGLIGGRAAVFLDQREHAQNAPHSEFGLALVDDIADSADAGSSLVRPRQQLLEAEVGYAADGPHRGYGVRRASAADAHAATVRSADRAGARTDRPTAPAPGARSIPAGAP